MSTTNSIIILLSRINFIKNELFTAIFFTHLNLILLYVFFSYVSGKDGSKLKRSPDRVHELRDQHKHELSNDDDKEETAHYRSSQSQIVHEVNKIVNTQKFVLIGWFLFTLDLFLFFLEVTR